MRLRSPSGLTMVASCPLLLQGSDGWPQAQDHVALANRAADGPSITWLELLLNQGCHMGPVSSGSLPGDNCWPVSRARMPHAERVASWGEGEAERQCFPTAPVWPLSKPKQPYLRGKVGSGICPCNCRQKIVSGNLGGLPYALFWRNFQSARVEALLAQTRCGKIMGPKQWRAGNSSRALGDRSKDAPDCFCLSPHASP